MKNKTLKKIPFIFTSTMLFGITSIQLPTQASALELICPVLPQLFTLYTRDHYVHKSITQEIKSHTIDQFVKNLDPSKTLMYSADAEKIKKDLQSIWTTMETGDCSKIEQVNGILVDRAVENEKIARELLGDSYKFDDSVELITDPDKRKYPADTNAKRDFIRKMIHFQISNYLLSKTKLPEAKKNVIHSYELVVKRMKEKNAQKRYVDFAEAFALALDPHSSYMSTEMLDEFRISMQLSLEGIGASLSSQDGFTVIEEVIPGGAADRQKTLKAKDKIVAVAQDKAKPESVIDLDLNDVVRKIRGKKGTKVTLTILRQGDKSQTLDVTIVRDKIDIKDSAAKITYENRKLANGKMAKIGVIDLPSFYGGGREARSSYTDMKTLVIEAKKNKVDGLILDLSRNGGGLLDDAVKIAGLFIKKGGVVATKGSDQTVDVLSDRDEEVQYNGPLMVVTSRLSASASEILSGALKDYKRAIIVGGDHTFGKGTVQVVKDLQFGLGAMKVTTGMFFVPGGKSTQHLGVDSDIVLPSTLNDDEIGEKSMDYSLPQQKVDRFVSDDANSSDEHRKWIPIDSTLVDKLRKKSIERVAKNPKFDEIIKNIEEIKKNKGVVKLADMRQKAEKEDKDTKKKDKRGKEKLKETQGPTLKESVEIMSDWIQGV